MAGPARSRICQRVIEPGKSVTVTLSKAGTYLIGCAFHYGEGMHDVLASALRPNRDSKERLRRRERRLSAHLRSEPHGLLRTPRGSGFRLYSSFIPGCYFSQTQRS